MTKEFIVSQESYINKQQEKKNSYHRIGEIISFQTERGIAKIVKLYANPSQKYYLQEEKKEENKGREYSSINNTVQPEPKADVPVIDVNDGETINIEDLDF